MIEEPSPTRKHIMCTWYGSKLRNGNISLISSYLHVYISVSVFILPLRMYFYSLYLTISKWEPSRKVVRQTVKKCCVALVTKWAFEHGVGGQMALTSPPFFSSICGQISSVKHAHDFVEWCLLHCLKILTNFKNMGDHSMHAWSNMTWARFMFQRSSYACGLLTAPMLSLAFVLLFASLGNYTINH